MLAQMTKKERPIKWLHIEDLRVEWAEAQRPLSERKVAQIMRDFDPDAMGIITVAELNGKGDEYHIVDGQHRVEAVKRLWGDLRQRVECQIITGVTSPAEAARVWLGRNVNHTTPTPLERFEVRVTAGEEQAVAIQEIVGDMGFTVGRSGIQAITAVEFVFKKHGAEGLRWVLQVIHDTWRDPSPTNQIIKGFGKFYGSFAGNVETDRLVENLAKRYTPDSLVGAARSAAEIMPGGVPECVVRLMANVYNMRLGDDRRLQVA